MPHSQISRTPSLATQILGKKMFFMKKNSKEIQNQDYEVFCLHPTQTRQILRENLFSCMHSAKLCNQAYYRTMEDWTPEAVRNGLADKPHLRF